MIRRNVQDGIAVFTMEYKRANALDLEFAAALTVALRAEQTSSTRAAVLTGNGRIFSAGVDLLRLVDGGPAYVDPLLGVLRELIRAILEHPKPLVAAVNGHAVAGGCAMACACDYRIMARGSGRMGVPELLVGVPFPTAAVEALRATTPPHLLQETVYGGKTYPPEEALERGLVDRLVEPDELLDQACARAAELARIPPETFRLTKRQLRTHALDALLRAEEDGTEAAIAAAWAREDTLEAVRRYVDRTLRKRK
jgi:enoyl-CoA hydratase